MEQDGLVTEGRIGIGRVRDGAWRVSFSGLPAKGVSPDRVIEAARAYIADLGSKGLSDEVVARLKMRIDNERALLVQQPALYAQALMNWLSAHYTYEHWRTRQARHAAVTPAAVNRLLAIAARGGREVAGILQPASAVASGSPAGSGTSAPTATAPAASTPSQPSPQ